MSNLTPKFSLSFTKTFEKKSLQTSALGKDKSQIQEINKQSILYFDKNSKPFEPPKLEDSLVIPLVESKRESLFKNLLSKANKEKGVTSVPAASSDKNEEKQTNELSLDEQAVAAVLEETSQKLEGINKSIDGDTSPSQNVISSVSVADLINDEGQVSTLEDYDEMNVDHFGAALLRGMGWSKDKGIGRKTKQVVEIINPANLGFALSSTEGKKKKSQQNDGEEEEELELKKGSYVLIEGGRNRGTYGVVESVDEDHILVRAAREDKVLRDVEQNTRVVTAKEYKDFSRVINKEMYDDYKAAESQKKKEKRENSDKESSKDSRKRKKDEEQSRERTKKEFVGTKKDLNEKHRKEDNDNYNKEMRSEDKKNRDNKETRRDDRVKPSSRDIVDKREKERHRGEKEYQKYKERSREERYEKLDKGSREEERTNKAKETPKASDALQMPVIPWARENLRVRIIDKDFKGGKYHKEKVVVCSIDTVDSCTCISDEGKMLYDLNPNHLETVIPKLSSATVLIVKGSYKGQKARILELNKDKEKATIQLLEERSVILKLYFDDICEYVSR